MCNKTDTQVTPQITALYAIDIGQNPYKNTHLLAPCSKICSVQFEIRAFILTASTKLSYHSENTSAETQHSAFSKPSSLFHTQKDIIKLYIYCRTSEMVIKYKFKR